MGEHLFVQPAVSILESLVAVRVHLDDCETGAGPLRAMPGSDRRGRLSASEGGARGRRVARSPAWRNGAMHSSCVLCCRTPHPNGQCRPGVAPDIFRSARRSCRTA
jgi:hypothetical protein